MKDLDKTQVYDLRGITEEQARELLEWLAENYIGWVTNHDSFYSSIQEYTSIKYTEMYGWHISDNKHTTHISTLFKKSYEDQLKEAHRNGAKIEIWNDFLDNWFEVDPVWTSNREYRIKPEEKPKVENESKPKVGDVVKFYDDDADAFVIGKLEFIGYSDEGEYYEDKLFTSYENAKTIVEQEVINLLFKKS